MTREPDPNPYATPTARVLSNDMHAAFVQSRRLAPWAWTRWYAHGWEQFIDNPFAWMGATFAFVVICAVVLIVPLGQLAAQALQFIFLGGLLLGCREHDAGGHFGFRYLFEGFASHGGQLALIGVLCTAAFIGFFLLVGVGVGISGLALSLADWTSFASLTHAAIPALALLVVLLIFLSVLGMAVWFAPALVVLYGVSAMSALKMSYQGFLRNVIPLTFFGLVWIFFALCASLLLGLGYLVLIPVTIGAVYASTREVFDASVAS